MLALHHQVTWISENIDLCGLAYPKKDEHAEYTGRFMSSGPNKSPITIETTRIHPDSDRFDQTKDYIGLIFYLRKGQSIYQFNDKEYKTGDIVIKSSDRVFKETEGKKPKKPNYIHGRLFYTIFGHWKHKKHGFVCGGFSYYGKKNQSKKWKFNSGTLNTMNPKNNDDTYHNTDRTLDNFEEKIIQKAITHLYENHQWLSKHPEDRIHFKTLLYHADPPNVHPDRELRGTVKSFDSNRGYGFIECIGFKENIFVHYSEIVGQPFQRRYLNKNDTVLFNIIHTHKGWQAKNVRST
ncbi:unnamed protein product [Adineta steineri]|uniref:CSD domain-containing protein n=1 Tax=Adineta steineri TaxID=433720 RepID=A0A814TCX1_9BILA|nr:unnamed protein product [Adineta steineri]